MLLCVANLDLASVIWIEYQGRSHKFQEKFAIHMLDCIQTKSIGANSLAYMSGGPQNTSGNKYR